MRLAETRKGGNGEQLRSRRRKRTTMLNLADFGSVASKTEWVLFMNDSPGADSSG